MHSLFYFNSTLSDNDIAVFAMATPSVHTQPNCRCPPSHPIARERLCENPSSGAQVPRVNIDTHHPSLINDDNLTTWWQSGVGDIPVNMTISLDGLRAALTVIMSFRSLQPQSMVLYYSSDGGNTFSPRQYYSSDCSRFGLTNNGLLRTASDVNCITSESSPPLENQVIQFRVLDIGNRPEADNYFLSADLQIFALASHIRLQLINWNTDVLENQFFTINEVFVGGQECICNGHANTCVGSTCVCQHNTAGGSCDMCLPLYNNEPWAPGTLSSVNQCQECECNNHADSCLYNETGMTGICDDCRDNTQGAMCESCNPFFYNPPEVPIGAPLSCLPCDCQLDGVRDNGDCSARGLNAGQCDCKIFVTGRQCDQCQSGYYNLTGTNLDGCVPCECDVRGTIGAGVSCDVHTGQCPCKANIVGRDCSLCAPGHYGIDNLEGCLPCHQQCNGCMGPGPISCLVSYLTTNNSPMTTSNPPITR